MGIRLIRIFLPWVLGGSLIIGILTKVYSCGRHDGAKKVTTAIDKKAKEAKEKSIEVGKDFKIKNKKRDSKAPPKSDKEKAENLMEDVSL